MPGRVQLVTRLCTKIVSVHSANPVPSISCVLRTRRPNVYTIERTVEDAYFPMRSLYADVRRSSARVACRKGAYVKCRSFHATAHACTSAQSACTLTLEPPRRHFVSRRVFCFPCKPPAGRSAIAVPRGAYALELTKQAGSRLHSRAFRERKLLHFWKGGGTLS